MKGASMTTQFEIAKEITFDQFEIFSDPAEVARESIDIASLVLNASQVTIDLADVYRVPRYYHDRRENNAEHSYMLGMLAMNVGAQYYPGMDSGALTKLALVHDLVEIETKDMPTFKATPEELEMKQKAEHEALEVLLKRLPAHSADMLAWYEEQLDPEPRLVRHLDKLLPFSVDINGPGVQVMREDYDVTTASQMLAQSRKLDKRFRGMFPDPSHEILHGAHGVLADRFASDFDVS